MCEAEFTAFGQKRRTEITRKRKPSPHRPGAVMDAERLEHCDRQVARLRDLEMRQVAKLTATRAALKLARARLASAEATSRAR
ncbi:hypothetical protein ACFXEL_24905 [Streptomyces sp. NPDC059382]|uniref:hypothetical protein n=1 Tax=unclassified Streptomyces TaxID=2593676 RepID=UPI003322249D